jgi:hypothetical protein
MLPFPFFTTNVLFQELIYLCIKFHQNRLSSFGSRRACTVEYVVYYINCNKCPTYSVFTFIQTLSDNYEYNKKIIKSVIPIKPFSSYSFTYTGQFIFISLDIPVLVCIINASILNSTDPVKGISYRHVQ